MGEMTKRRVKLPLCFWPEAKSETGIVIRIGRALHWLGSSFAIILVFFVLISEMSRTFGGQTRESADQLVDLRANHNSLVNDQPARPITRKELDGMLADKNPLLDLPPPEWMKHAIPADPNVTPSYVASDAGHATERLESSIEKVFNALFIAFAAMAVGRAFRYILANE
jgi:hypothetical protein